MQAKELFLRAVEEEQNGALYEGNGSLQRTPLLWRNLMLSDLCARLHDASEL